MPLEVAMAQGFYAEVWSVIAGPQHLDRIIGSKGRRLIFVDIRIAAGALLGVGTGLSC
ncbi:hypothetical protein NKI20_17155 [Mesorhizobium sp. M0830]|uniref:hypothetical protein n=1 Tax=Mesorhizobium sp. M0830 TaxID=2957008 RepID=UPI003338A728